MTAKRPEGISPAIDHDALLGKSKLYIQRALLSRSKGDDTEYQLWASLALELLGKAVLAMRHPCLIVHPQHPNSLLAAAGVNFSVNVRTISAKTVYERLRHLSQEFDQHVKQSCIDISQRRNAELHSGESPFSGMVRRSWEGRYWHAADLILSMIDSSFEEWVTQDEAPAAKQIVEQAHHAWKQAVLHRIELHKTNTAQRIDKTVRAVPMLAYDHLWLVDCPACSQDGEMAGMQWDEEQLHTVYDDLTDEYYETVLTHYVGEEFLCPNCGLHLRNYEEVTAADLDFEHSEERERIAEFVEEYMNE